MKDNRYRWNSFEMAKYYRKQLNKEQAMDRLVDITGYPMIVVREALRYEGIIRPSDLDVLPGMVQKEQILFLKRLGYSITRTSEFLGIRYGIVKEIRQAME